MGRNVAKVDGWGETEEVNRKVAGRYGDLAPKVSTTLMAKKAQLQHFDSADYNMLKQGCTPDSPVAVLMLVPEQSFEMLPKKECRVEPPPPQPSRLREE
eukprot:jgi/Botrbrau1/10026/Bobra.0012s0113.1